MALQFINYNGTIYPANHPILTTDNRVFRYGDGLFETIRVKNGILRFADLHIQRLKKGMQILKLDNNSAIDIQFLTNKVKDLIKRNQLGQHVRIRLSIFREGDGFYTPTHNQSGYLIESFSLDGDYDQAYPKGLIAGIFEDIYKPINPLSNLKTCNALIYVLAGVYKNQKRVDEVFLLNQNKYLCEGITSNIFVAYNQQLYTPALSEGCVDGVMRKVVMELASINNIPVVEAQINPAILEQAEEIFTTNAINGIQYIMGYGKKRYFNEMSRFLMEKLTQLE